MRVAGQFLEAHKSFPNELLPDGSQGVDFQSCFPDCGISSGAHSVTDRASYATKRLSEMNQLGNIQAAIRMLPVAESSQEVRGLARLAMH